MKLFVHIGLLPIALLTNIEAVSQNYITNSGFEGPDGVEVIPSDWFAGCGIMNTPDTQPGWWNIENKPYEGQSYINLLFKDDGTTESVYQKLATPLQAGACYLIEIHLAQACQDSLSGLYPYDLNHPGDLSIRGSATYGCTNGQILAKFEQVNNCRWRTFYAVFQADSNINYIYLEFEKGVSAFQNGSILIDQFILEDIHPFPDHTLEINYENSVQLTASASGNNHVWTENAVLLASDTASISLILEANTVITLTYLADDSCLVEETFILYVKPQIPNIITPLDMNGINDTFYIHGLTENATLYVINRWGQLVFSEIGYTNTWCPLNLDQGTYFFRIDLQESGRTFQGTLQIQ